MYDYLIVGAGLAGAVFTSQAIKHGSKVLVVDRRSHVGGNIYTENKEGIDVHMYGPHIFHTSDKRVWDFVNQYGTFNTWINRPLACYEGRLYSLPFNMKTFNQLWGVEDAQMAKCIIDNQKKDVPENIVNLYQQAISMVGNEIYEKFIKGYTKKQWGRSCDELSPEIIKRIPVRFDWNDNYYDDTFQGIPEGGYTNIVQNMLRGATVLTGVDYIKDKKRLDLLADKIIYTGAIDEYFNYCYNVLEYRTVQFESQWIDKEWYQPAAVINYTGEDVPYTRVIEHKHFGADSQLCKTSMTDSLHRTIITKEYSVEWNPSLEPYYPIDNERNAAIYGQYKSLAEKEKNTLFVGRLAEYRYYDMDDIISRVFEITDKCFGKF